MVVKRPRFAVRSLGFDVNLVIWGTIQGRLADGFVKAVCSADAKGLDGVFDKCLDKRRNVNAGDQVSDHVESYIVRHWFGVGIGCMIRA
jgi:hypothetical protein